MARKLQIKRGPAAQLPVLAEGELALTTDEKKVYIGTNAGNKALEAQFGPVAAMATVAGWVGSGPWTQTVSVAGVLASDNGLGVYPVDVADATARKLYEEAYSLLAVEAETATGGVTLTCRHRKPTVNIQIVVKGVR